MMTRRTMLTTATLSAITVAGTSLTAQLARAGNGDPSDNLEQKRDRRRNRKERRRDRRRNNQ